MISREQGPCPQPTSEDVGSAFCVDDGITGAGPDTGVRTQGFGNTPLPVASRASAPQALPDLMILYKGLGTFLHLSGGPLSVARAGLWAGFQAGPLPTPTSPGSEVGPGEAEEESGLGDQSVQCGFFCACASSLLTLGSEVGRVSRDTDPRLELALGWGAPGSGKPWTLLRNSSGGGNGSQRFLRMQEASCGRTWAPG